MSSFFFFKLEILLESRSFKEPLIILIELNLLNNVLLKLLRLDTFLCSFVLIQETALLFPCYFSTSVGSRLAVIIRDCQTETINIIILMAFYSCYSVKFFAKSRTHCKYQMLITQHTCITFCFSTCSVSCLKSYYYGGTSA